MATNMVAAVVTNFVPVLFTNMVQVPVTNPKTSELEFVMGRMDFGTRFWTRDSLVGNWSSLPGAPAGS
jgi:hypothetical protein